MIEHPPLSERQFKSIMLYLRELEGEFANLDVGERPDQKRLAEELGAYEIPITHEYLRKVWKLIQEQMYGITSIKDLRSDQVELVYDVFNRFTSERWGIGLHFPDIHRRM